MIDPQSETLKTKNEARRLPWMKGRYGNAVSLATLDRWMTRGVGGVVLESCRIGGTTYTSDEATLRFLDRLNGADQNGAGQPDTRPASHRRQQIARADRRLDDAGIV